MATITYDCIKRRNQGDMDASTALSMQNILLYFSSKEKIDKLQNKYERVFKLTPVQYQISFNDLMKGRRYIINKLLVIFDKKTPDIMALLLGASLIGISRFLEIDFSNLAKYNYIKNLQLLDYKSAKEIVEVFKLLTIMPSEDADRHCIHVSKLLQSIRTKNLSSGDFITIFRSYFFDFFLKEMNLGISKEELIKSNTYTQDELINILIGYRGHHTNGYMPVLQQILKCYLQGSTHQLQDFLWKQD